MKSKRKLLPYIGTSLPEKQIVHAIQSGDPNRAYHIKTVSCSRTRWNVLTEGKWISVTYDKNRKCIITALPKTLLDEIRQRLLERINFSELYEFLKAKLGCSDVYSLEQIWQYIYCHYSKEKADHNFTYHDSDRNFYISTTRVMEDLNLIKESGRGFRIGC